MAGGLAVVGILAVPTAARVAVLGCVAVVACLCARAGTGIGAHKVIRRPRRSFALLGGLGAQDFCDVGAALGEPVDLYEAICLTLLVMPSRSGPEGVKRYAFRSGMSPSLLLKVTGFEFAGFE